MGIFYRVAGIVVSFKSPRGKDPRWEDVSEMAGKELRNDEFPIVITGYFH